MQGGDKKHVILERDSLFLQKEVLESPGNLYNFLKNPGKVLE